MSSPDNKSYLSGLTQFSPWGSRSGTPGAGQDKAKEANKDESPLSQLQKGGDHSVGHRHRLSRRDYLKDTPALKVRWFHAVDVPKRKQHPAAGIKSEKETQEAKKYVPFSAVDSRAIEAAFQKEADKEDDEEREHLRRGGEKSTGSAKEALKKETIKVPVNEDYLFDVDIRERELAPTYWLGPVYDVRRGSWFFQDGSNLKPCDENLAAQLEEGYLKVQPWKFPPQQKGRSSSQPRSRPVSLRSEAELNQPGKSQSSPSTPKNSADGDRPTPHDVAVSDTDEQSPKNKPMKAIRLFGVHMNSVVTYQDEGTAWIVTDDFLSRMSSTVYERFAGGGHLAGVKVFRGYREPKNQDKEKDKEVKSSDSPTSPKSPSNTAPKQSKTENSAKDEAEESKDSKEEPKETPRQALARQITNLVRSGSFQNNPEEEAEEVRKREEKEIQDDYKDREDDEQGREIEHLLLVTHGIGQRLGLRIESVNFVHDVNTLRKTLKSVYSNSTDLQALNDEVNKPLKNCRVQVLPICWRHLLDFPRHSLKHNRREHDLGDVDSSQQDNEYPNLDDITVDGVPAVRNLITDLALDILLYQSPVYKDHLGRIVREECNRIYKLFKQRHPEFKGKVSLVGHSLGSAVMFDILCNQSSSQSSSSSRSSRKGKARENEVDLKLDFEVEDFFALGSPIGLFQMLRGRTISGRQAVSKSQTKYTLPFPLSSAPSKDTVPQSDMRTSTPSCHNLFNIFHPTDPISYRLEPLISRSMTNLKPQPLPYTKKGVFGVPVSQGISGIGARVGQSVSGLWTSFSSGIATSLLNRSLGLSADDAQRLGGPIPTGAEQSPGAGTNAVEGGVISARDLAKLQQNAKPGVRASELLNPAEVKAALAQVSGSLEHGSEGAHPPTLLDAGLETLYSGFEKRRGEVRDEVERSEEARRLRREEERVKGVNGRGRVDYSIQEGVFDISLLASIASHLTYWSDEDVCHFIISQLLSQQRIIKGTSPKGSPEPEDR